MYFFSALIFHTEAVNDSGYRGHAVQKAKRKHFIGMILYSINGFKYSLFDYTFS